jgi:glycosyltransferase involved in cell wall biosynthesis
MAERWLARRADQVITVSDGIADVMAHEMQIPRPAVVTNMPPLPSPARHQHNSRGPLRQALSLDATIPILLYQGKFAPTKGVEVLIGAMTHMENRSAVLVLLGEGPLESELRSLVIALDLKNRVLFHHSVPGKILHQWTRDATIGVYAIEGRHLSKRLSLANKFFEYIQGGLAVLVADMPEMRRYIDRYQFGEVFPEGNVRVLANRIDSLLKDPERLARYRAAAESASIELDRGRGEVLEGLYRRLITSRAT